MRIDQILPNMAYGDAISDHAFELKRLFKSWGFESEIFALFREGPISHSCRPIDEFRPHSEDLIFYHYSIGCKKVSDLVLKSSGRKIFVYHNITPHQYFFKYSSVLFELLRDGREALTEFRDVVDLAIGDSDFNSQELLDLGYKKVETFPIFVDFRKFEGVSADPQMLKYLGSEWTTFLFTGRVVPNKAPHDLIRTFAWYYHHVNRFSRLILVGMAPIGGYFTQLLSLIESLGVKNSVFFPGRVKFSELLAIYQKTDVFLCMSEHEGFCVPLLEAMHFQIPILAYASSGIPFTLGNSGILFKRKDPELVSELAYLLTSDSGLRGKVIRGQNARLNDFKSSLLEKKYRDLVKRFEE